MTSFNLYHLPTATNTVMLAIRASWCEFWWNINIQSIIDGLLFFLVPIVNQCLVLSDSYSPANSLPMDSVRHLDILPYDKPPLCLS